MHCPYCNHEETKVIDKRNTDAAIRRRRECLKCTKRWTTFERIDHVDLYIIKRDGTKEPYDGEKMRKGLKRAFEKRPSDEETIEKIATDVENKIRSLESTEIPAKKIGQFILTKLKIIDKIAYLRFASVYKMFDDVESFEQELKKLK